MSGWGFGGRQNASSTASGSMDGDGTGRPPREERTQRLISNPPSRKEADNFETWVEDMEQWIEAMEEGKYGVQQIALSIFTSVGKDTKRLLRTGLDKDARKDPHQILEKLKTDFAKDTIDKGYDVWH